MIRLIVKLTLVLGSLVSLHWADDYGNSSQTPGATFNYVRQKIIVQVYLRKKGPFNFVIDTGVHPSGVDFKLAKEVGMPLGSIDGYVAGFGNDRIPLYRTSMDAMEVGNLQLKAVRAVAFDMSHLKVEEIPIHGILGHDFLRRFATRIDYANDSLTFFKKLPEYYEEALEQFVKRTFELDGGLIPKSDDLIINGKHINAWLDTGAGTTISLSRTTAEQLGFGEVAKEGRMVPARGSRGDFQLREIKIDSISIFGIKKKEVTCMVFERGGKDIIGNGFFQEYVVTFDYPNRKLYLE